MTPQEKIAVIIEGKNESQKAFDSVKSELASLSKAAAAAAVTLGVAAVRGAAQFEKSMANVATLVDTSTESIEEMGEKVKEIAKRTPVELADLTAALYDVRSAGISAEDAMLVLEKSARLAVAGLGTTKEAVNLSTSAINAFGLKGEDAARAFDTLQLTVKSGKTTVAELAQSFGMVAGVANTAGVSFEELQAATAALTTTGLTASVAQTQLRAAILAIQAPSDSLRDAISAMGYESGAAMIAQLGLVESMRQIDEAVGGNVNVLKKHYGSVEALGAALSLTGAQGDAFKLTLDQMTNSSGVLDEAFQKQNQTFDAQFQILKNNLGVALAEIGSSILPQLTESMTVTNAKSAEMTAAIEVLKFSLNGIIAVIGWVVGGWYDIGKGIGYAILAFIDFSKRAGEIMGQAKDLILGKLSEIQSVWNDAWQAMGDFVFGVFDAVVEKITSVFDWVSDKINTLKNIGSSAVSAITSAASSVGGSLKNTGKTVAGIARFATGGSFVVGGQGGTDSTPVSFLATPGERVTVETPGQQSRGGGMTVVVNVMGSVMSERDLTETIARNLSGMLHLRYSS